MAIYVSGLGVLRVATEADVPSPHPSGGRGFGRTEAWRFANAFAAFEKSSKDMMLEIAKDRDESEEYEIYSLFDIVNSYLNQLRKGRELFPSNLKELEFGIPTLLGYAEAYGIPGTEKHSQAIMDSYHAWLEVITKSDFGTFAGMRRR